jgi:hypothetical protein
MKKIFLIIFLFIFTLPVSAGNNLSVTCDALSCTKSSNLQLFDEKNIAPGFSKTQTITVINERPDRCNLQFKLSQSLISSPLYSVLMLSVFENNTIKTAGPFNDLANNKNHSIGNIDSHQSKDYLWTTSLNQSLGNDYKLLKSFYDLDLNFICGEGGESDNSCYSSSPVNYPINFKATPGQHSVTLTWEETKDLFTYYLISYSSEKHAATFADANIGGRGTTSHTIYNLSADVTYYFKIRTGNFCAPGPFSDIVSATPSGQKILNSNLSNYSPAVLGKNNSPAFIPSKSAVSKPGQCFKVFPYAFILAFLLNLIFSRYYLLTLFVSLLSLLADYYLNKYLCRNYHYFYINNLLSFILPFIFSLKKSKT